MTTLLLLTAFLISIVCSAGSSEKVRPVVDEPTPEDQAQQGQRADYSYYFTDRRQQLERHRVFAYSCIYIARYYLLVNERALKEFQAIARGFETIKNREERKKAELGAWRRVYTDAVKLCSQKQTQDRAQQVFEELKNYQLVVTEYYDLVDSLDFESYKERKAKLTFDEEEENIWRLVEVQGYEKALEEKNKKDAQNAQSQEQAKEKAEVLDREPQVMGTSLNFGESLQITVLIGVFSLFGAIFFCIFRKLTKESVDSKTKIGRKKKN